MIQTLATVVGLVLAGVGALYFAYTKVMEYWFSNQIAVDNTKLAQATTTVTNDDTLVKTAAIAAEEAVKAYEDAKSDTSSTSNTPSGTNKPS